MSKHYFVSVWCSGSETDSPGLTFPSWAWSGRSAAAQVGLAVSVVG